MHLRRLPIYFVLGAVLGWQMWQNAPRLWTWRQTAGLSLVNRRFLLLADGAHSAWSLLLADPASAKAGHTRAVLEGSQSHLCLWLDHHRRRCAVLESALSSVDFCSCDSAASLACTKRGARFGRKVWRRLSGLPQADLVLNRGVGDYTSTVRADD